jgi:hypothetical protein
LLAAPVHGVVLRLVDGELGQRLVGGLVEVCSRVVMDSLTHWPATKARQA